jgi:CDP-diacylglycerol--glycerol-3-phosphate 3-phosphatidyltransferase
VSASAPPVRRFGPGAIATPANAVTVVRLLFAVPTLILIARNGATWLTFGMWTVLACSDGLDGWLARRDGTTRSGAFLDPLADKFLVAGGFLALLARGDISWIPVVIVVGREAGISAYRSLAARRGISLPARQLGKWKTFIQLCAIAAFVFPPTSDAMWFQQSVLWIAVAFTIISAVDILLTGWQEAQEARP